MVEICKYNQQVYESSHKWVESERPEGRDKIAERTRSDQRAFPLKQVRSCCALTPAAINCLDYAINRLLPKVSSAALIIGQRSTTGYYRRYEHNIPCDVEKTRSATYLHLKTIYYGLVLGTGLSGKVTKSIRIHAGKAETVAHKRQRRQYYEVKVLQKLQDVPGVIKLHDYRHYTTRKGRKKTSIIMEHCDLGYLKPYKVESLTESEQRDLYTKIVDTVKAIHDKGIAHGDIHNKNIMLKMVDGRIEPRIIDFGWSEPANAEMIDRDRSGLKDVGIVLLGAQGYEQYKTELASRSLK